MDGRWTDDLGIEQEKALLYTVAKIASCQKQTEIILCIILPRPGLQIPSILPLL